MGTFWSHLAFALMCLLATLQCCYKQGFKWSLMFSIVVGFGGCVLPMSR